MRFSFFMGIGVAVIYVILFFLTDEWMFITLASLTLLVLEIMRGHYDRQRFKEMEAELLKELDALK